MPKHENINKVMIIGSGPIVIGQACEFDYSGTQACKANDAYIRQTAIKCKIPYVTTLAAAVAAAKGIAACRKGREPVKSLQDYHRDIK